MKFFINDKGSKIVAFDGKEAEIFSFFFHKTESEFAYRRIDEVDVVDAIGEGEEAPRAKRQYKKRGRIPKTEKPERGSKSAAIVKFFEENEGASAKEAYKILCKKWPTMSMGDVYNARARMAKSTTSDTFVAKPPVKTEEDFKDGRAEMIQKFGKTAVEKVIDLDLNGYDTRAIAYHHEVRLKVEEVEEIVEKCV